MVKKDDLTTSLKEESRNWSKEQWEQYLRRYEKQRKEPLLKNYEKINELSQEERDKAFESRDQLKTEELDKIKLTISKILDHLPIKQKEIIHDIFWKDMSLSRIAKKRGVSKHAIYKLKQKALREIENNLLKLTNEMSLNTENNRTVSSIGKFA